MGHGREPCWSIGKDGENVLGFSHNEGSGALNLWLGPMHIMSTYGTKHKAAYRLLET